jgi:aspartokinase
VAVRSAGDHLSLVTAVVSGPASALLTAAESCRVLGRAGIEVLRATRTATTESILVPARQAGEAAAALHSALQSVLLEAAEPLPRAG